MIQATDNKGSLIQSSIIERIEAQRNAALERFARAFDLLQEAHALMPGGQGENLRELSDDLCGYSPNRERYVERCRKNVDALAWRTIIDDHGFEKLMDRQARDEFRAQLANDPPALTASTAHATLLGLLSDADMLFRRGIALAFSKLDRRFRSHDGFKIGSRMVLSYAYDSWGHWNHHRRHDDTLRDVERVFCQMEKLDLPERDAGIVGAVSEAGRRKVFPFVVENPFFRVRVFKNGNLHIWFLRDDLVRQCNKLLAEYYGETLGAGPDVAGKTQFDNPKRTLAKNEGFFPSPEAVVHRLLDQGNPYGTHRVLEPSAGDGAIALEVRNQCKGASIVCVEVNAQRCATLQGLGFNVRRADFLDLTPTDLGAFDRIYMNPPFDYQRDIDHVAHAVQFLRPGGRLVAVMSAGVEFRENAKAVAFRQLIEHMKGKITDLPVGSFAEVGTNVNTCLVMLQKAS